jgi:hypothetical protein
MTTLQSLLNEEHLQSSPRGHSVIALGTFLAEQGDCKASVDIAVQLCSRITEILEGSKRNRRLPTAVIGKVWNNFHKLRFNPQIQVLWASYQTALHTPPSLQGEGKLLLQLLLDRILKHLIATEASECSTAAVPEHHVNLTSREQNVIRYMAGYVVRKMKKKFKETSKQPEIQRKRQLFLCVLAAMESKDQDDAISSFQSTCDWVEMIDREGLCHVNNDTYILMEAIEVETRRYLRPDGAQQAPGQAVQQQIISSILDNKAILSRWDFLASPIPPRSEAYSLELLKEVATLWTTVRCFSFAKSWNDKTSQEKFKKHGTRKTLQHKD